MGWYRTARLLLPWRGRSDGAAPVPRRAGRSRLGSRPALAGEPGASRDPTRRDGTRTPAGDPPPRGSGFPSRAVVPESGGRRISAGGGRDRRPGMPPSRRSRSGHRGALLVHGGRRSGGKKGEKTPGPSPGHDRRPPGDCQPSLRAPPRRAPETPPARPEGRAGTSGRAALDDPGIENGRPRGRMPSPRRRFWAADPDPVNRRSAGAGGPCAGIGQNPHERARGPRRGNDRAALSHAHPS